MHYNQSIENVTLSCKHVLPCEIYAPTVLYIDVNFTPVLIQSLLKLLLTDLKTCTNGICTGYILRHQTHIKSVLLTLNKPRLRDFYKYIHDKLLFRGCIYSSKDHFGTFVKQEYCLCWEQMYLK